MKVILLAFCTAAATAAGATPVRAQAIPNHLQDLQALRRDYPAQITQAQAGELLARLVWQLRAEGFGLLRKDGGNTCPIPNSAIRVSCDWVIHAPSGKGCDVLGSGPDPDGPGPSVPSWCAGEPADMSRFVAPVDPGGATPPQPPAEDPRIAQLQQQLASASARVAQLQQQLADGDTALAAKDQQLLEAWAERDRAREDLAKELAKPAPSCEAKVPPLVKQLGIRIGCRVIQ